VSRILVVEDDERTAASVLDVLLAQNHVVDVATNGPDGLECLLGHHYELAILDWGLPGMEGFLVCQNYRQSGGTSPILFLTAENELPKKVRALDSGADDYLCKPFSMEELLARVNALLRRQRKETSKTMRSGNLAVDLGTGEVTIGDTAIVLTAGEFRLLNLLMQNAEQVFSVSAILEKLAVAEPESTEAGIRQMIMCLRKKLAKDGNDACIKTVKNAGYFFKPCVVSAGTEESDDTRVSSGY
jgi:DNA-binding response OmpR family regulator